MQLTAGDRKVLLVAASLFLLMVVAAFVLVGGASSDAEVPSVYSTASQGCKAAFLLLKQSGYQVQAWEQSLLDLPEGKGKTLIILEPISIVENKQKQKLESFLRSGGSVIAAGQYSSFYLPRNDAVADPISASLWRQIPALTPSLITRAAPTITMAPQWYWHSGKGAIPVYGDAEKPVVVEYKVGTGKVLWIAAATPFTNAGLKEKGNLEFMLAALGEPGQSQILWDEYVHGYQQLAASKTHAVLGWIGLQIALLLGAILFTYSRRSGPVWIPQGEVRLSPLEFVRTLGSLYEHAHASGVALDICYQRFRYLLTRRLGLPVNSSANDLARAVRERRGISDAEFARTLSDCESYRYDSAVPPQAALRLMQSLFDFEVSLNLIHKSTGEKKAWKQS
jgi:hypothetical protein